MNDLHKNAKIYVAGHRGMVGSAILRKLQAEGYRRILTRGREELDLLNQSDVDSFFAAERPDVVFLAAAKVGGIAANMNDLAGFLYENLQIQNHVIHAAAQNDVKKFIFLGSSCIYPRNCPQPIKEDYLLTAPFEPTNEGYAIAKIAGMKLCSYLAKIGTWEAISVIPCNLYGPGDNYDQATSHVMAALIKRFVDAAQSGAPKVTCWGTGAPRREFLHVDDLVRGIFMLLDDNPFGSDPVNIGYGSDLTIKELAELIARQSGYTGKILWDGSKPDGMMQKLMDASRAEAIGFKPQIDIEEGVALAISDYRNFHQRDDVR